MQTNELKAVLEKTNEVAVYPAHIEVDLDHIIGIQRKRHGRVVCRPGLKRAVVIENGAKWIEHRQVAACSVEDYDIPHSNGVLVEFAAEDFNQPLSKLRFVKDRLYVDGSKTPYKHTEVIRERGKVKAIRMIISRKVIFSDWSSYALLEAAREKEKDEYERKRLALLEPQAAIMGLSPDEFEKRFNDNDPYVYLSAEWKEIPVRDSKGHVKYESYRTADGWNQERRVIDHEVGVISITVDQATKILDMLTPKQKAALKNG